MTRAESTRALPSDPPPRAVGAFTAALVLGLGILLAVFFLSWLDQRAEHRTEATTSFVGLTLQARFAEVLRQIRAIEGLVRGSSTIEPEEFASFTASTGFVPGVTAWGVVEVDRATGLPLAVIYESSSPESAEPDLFEVAGVVESIQRARWTRTSTATALDTDQQVHVFSPIVPPERTVRWLAMASVDVDEFLRANTPETMASLLDIQLVSGNEPVPRGATSFDVRLGDIQWMIIVRPTAGSGLTTPRSNVAITVVSVVLLAGLAGWGATAVARRRAAQMELAAHKKLNRARDDFLAAVSHEVRTPLSAVLGFASVLLRDWSWLDDATREDYLRTVAENANDVGAIVQDLLVVGRADIDGLHLSVREVSVADAVQHAIGTLAAESAGRIRNEAECLTVRGDRTRLRQIVRNLLANAIEHGGDRIVVDTEADAYHVWLRVSDDGPGIRPDDVQRIFEPYYQVGSTDRPLASMGLGLYVSRRLAEAMGGRLTYRRVDGVTVFELRLPAAGGACDQPGVGSTKPGRDTPRTRWATSAR